MEFDFEHTTLRVEELERQWRNLNQTVPPHAQDWWDRNMASQQQRIADLKTRMPSTREDWPAARGPILAEIMAIEELIQTAKDELGSRTAAGRAKR